MNEKFAPDLLESKPEIVECVMEQLDHMVRVAHPKVTKEENIKRVCQYNERFDSKYVSFGPAQFHFFFLFSVELVIHIYKA